jgi:dCTP deaminase
LILSAQSIRKRRPIAPFHERTSLNGMTFGLSSAGYDVRIRERVVLRPGDFALASTVERFTMPTDLIARVADKSSWARKGLTVQNTVIEPGWEGFLTLELANHGPNTLMIEAGSPIAQIIFELLDEPTEQPYAGKYQHQPPEPVHAIEEPTWGLTHEG